MLTLNNMFSQLINLYKPIALTPLQAILQLKAKLKQRSPHLLNQKMAYAGRLDPMAHGVLLVLIGDECKNRDIYQNLDKVYEFEVAFGLSTDSYDRLGIVDNEIVFPTKLDEKSIGQLVADFIGEYDLYYPPYSSKVINGKSLIHWAREGKLDQKDLPTKKFIVKEMEFLGIKKVEFNRFVNDTIEQVEDVEGDFRQLEIIKSWRDVLKQISKLYEANNSEQFLQIAKFKALVGSGTYIRVIAHEMGKKLGVGAIASDIKRIQVGEFDISKSEYIF